MKPARRAVSRTYWILSLLALLIPLFTSNSYAQIRHEEVERQQQQVIKAKWQQLIRQSLDLQKQAEQEFQREKKAVIDYVKQNAKDAPGGALDEIFPERKIQRLFEDKQVIRAFQDALHGDPLPWFEVVGKLAANELVDKLGDSPKTPVWADPLLIKGMLNIGSHFFSLNLDAKEITRTAEALLVQQAAINQTRKKPVDGKNTTNTTPKEALSDLRALDQTVIQLDRWLAVGDRVFDEKNGKLDRAAEDRFYTAFPELAMCAKCRRTAITGSPATEVERAFKDGTLEIRFDPSSMSPTERNAWLRNQEKMRSETLSQNHDQAAELPRPPLAKDGTKPIVQFSGIWLCQLHPYDESPNGNKVYSPQFVHDWYRAELLIGPQYPDTVAYSFAMFKSDADYLTLAPAHTILVTKDGFLTLTNGQELGEINGQRTPANSQPFTNLNGDRTNGKLFAKLNGGRFDMSRADWGPDALCVRQP